MAASEPPSFRPRRIVFTELSPKIGPHGRDGIRALLWSRIVGPIYQYVILAKWLAPECTRSFSHSESPCSAHMHLEPGIRKALATFRIAKGNPQSPAQTFNDRLSLVARARGRRQNSAIDAVKNPIFGCLIRTRGGNVHKVAGMRKTLALLTIAISLSAWCAHAGSEAGARLDFPPGYFSAKPAASKSAPSSASAMADDCPVDCVNFDAGYAWAEERGFAAETQCRGRSRSFVEGCMTYVVERRKCARSCR